MDEKTREILKSCGFREDFDPENRWQLKDTVTYKDKQYLISTVDLGLDHNFSGPRPLYYETMIFKVIGPDIKNRENIDFGGVYQNRYSTQAEAKAHHEYLVNAFSSGGAKIVDGYFEL